MFGKITPEKAGISSKKVREFVEYLERRGIVMHSIMMLRGNDIFAEYYYKPFDENYNHRQYSQTKSFVSIAIGLLQEEGKLELSDKIAEHFPEKIDNELSPFLMDQTIEDMLKMETSAEYPRWFSSGDPDRVHMYFNNGTMPFPSGTLFWYDSNGSQVLCALVEKLSGKTILEYLKEKLFNHMGTFKNAEILKTPNGVSWGDSALICTPRDMLSFARFVMNYGTWQGKRLMNAEYLKKATCKQCDNSDGYVSATSHGYGYQIWCGEQNSFMFLGMGGQDTVCVPDKDVIIVYNGDNQGNGSARDICINGFFDYIVNNLEDKPLAEDLKEYNLLESYTDALELKYIEGEKDSPIKEKINNVKFEAKENIMGIKWFSFEFTSCSEGVFRYENQQGEKELPFGIGKNVFCKFPQTGYSDGVGGLRSGNGFMYDSAVSLAFSEERKIVLKVQITDKYFGNLFAAFSFKEIDGSLTCAVKMKKSAEDFLDEYQGFLFSYAV